MHGSEGAVDDKHARDENYQSHIDDSRFKEEIPMSIKATSNQPNRRWHRPDNKINNSNKY